VGDDGASKTERDDHAPTELADSATATPATEAAALGPATVVDAEARVVGRFRLDAPLGAGGMADVYRAYDPMLDRAVALKILRTTRAGDDPQRMRRVLREARAAAALTHPNTVTIFDVGEADGEVFIAMELLEGEVLRSVLTRGETSVDTKLRWLLQAARALAAAHERGLVHRDVKPDNIFVCADGTLKLLDFGIAKRDDDDTLDPYAEPMGPSSLRTTEGRRVGTPRYMAPEQHAALPTDARTDEYAWGLVAFELLTGAHPVAALATMTIDDAKLAPATVGSAQVSELRAKVPALPDAVARAIARALEPRKEDRFPSMAPIVEALATALEPAASRAVSTSSPPSPRRSAPRRWLVPASAAVALVAFVALATGSLLARKAKRAREAARVEETANAATRAAAAAPACHVQTKRSVPVAPDDRATMLTDGSVVVARNIKRGVVLEREDGGQTVPYRLNPALAAVGHDYDDVALGGVRYLGEIAVVVMLDQGAERGGFVTIAGEHNGFANARLPAAVMSTAIVPFRRRVAILTTTYESTNLDGAVTLHLTSGDEWSHLVVEPIGATAGSLATSDDLIAAAYLHGRSLRFAMLDARGQRLGDAFEIAPHGGLPAVAFSGRTAVVTWISEDGGKRRLSESRFTPGDVAPSPPRIIADDAVLLDAPVAAELPTGRHVLAWVASVAGRSVIRVAPIRGGGGALEGTTDIETGTAFTNLHAFPSDDGITMSWREGDDVAKLTRVTCDPR